MAKTFTTLEEYLAFQNDRLRVLSLDRGRIGNWFLIEDQGTGELLAVRENGQGMPLTIRVIAAP